MVMRGPRNNVEQLKAKIVAKDEVIESLRVELAIAVKGSTQGKPA